MRKRIGEYVVLGLAILAAVALPLYLVGCGDTITNVTNTTTTNQTQGGSTPTPRPVAGAGSTESDVDSMAIFLYGYSCNAGIVPPQNNSWILPMGCRGNLTATPKRKDNSDAKNHGPNLTWSSSTDVAKLEPAASEPTFNRTLTPLKVGSITVTATLVDPAGVTHVAVREFTVVP